MDEILLSGTHMAFYLVLGVSFLVVFRSSGILNFTHGYLGVTAVYLFKTICESMPSLPMWAVVATTTTAMASVAVVAKFCINLLRSSRFGILPADSVLFGTIGLAFFLEGLLSYLSSGESAKISRLQVDPIATAAGLLVAAAALAMVLCSVLHFGGTRHVHRALRRDAPRHALLVVIGLAVCWMLAATGVALLLGSALARLFDEATSLELRYSVADLTVVPAAALFIVMTYFFERSKLGLVIRACRSNPKLGHNLGYSVPASELLPFVYSVTMVSLGGIVIAFAFDTVRISDAFRWTLFGFACGLLTTSIAGAVLAAAILALFEGAAVWVLNQQSLGEPTSLMVLALMILAAGLRPRMAARWHRMPAWFMARPNLRAH